MSAAPITESDGTVTGAAGTTTAPLVDACWAPASLTSPRPVSSAMGTTNHVSLILNPPAGARPLARGRVLLEAHVLDLVEERAVTDLQHLGCLHTIPAPLLERAS